MAGGDFVAPTLAPAVSGTSGGVAPASRTTASFPGAAFATIGAGDLQFV